MSGDMAQTRWLLLTLSLTGILAGDWSVHLPSGPICAMAGSSVVLPCSYDYPQSSQPSVAKEKQEYGVVSEMWCVEDSRCLTARYVFHSDGIFPDPSYQGRVQYLREPGKKSCSLRIQDLRVSDSGTYVFYLITNHTTQKMPEQSGIQLLVAGSSGAVPVSASSSGDIIEGAALRLACCSPAAQLEALYRWYKDTISTPKHTGQTLNIREVTSDDSGSYYCQIHTRDGVQNSTVLDVDVQYAPRHTTVSVRSAGQLGEKLPVTLTCSSVANPPVHTYTWYQGEACLPTADKSFHHGRRSEATPTGRGQTVSSVNITADEHSQHCCVARNRHGLQTRTVTLNSSEGSSVSRNVLIGVIIAILLAVLAVVAFIMSRRQRSSRHQSNALTERRATAL
ncbi:neuronal growth regulator 1-like [Aulostomus maculatus]